MGIDVAQESQAPPTMTRILSPMAFLKQVPRPVE